jgi:trk system potassium uptake protein TrkH
VPRLPSDLAGSLSTHPLLLAALLGGLLAWPLDPDGSVWRVVLVVFYALAAPVADLVRQPAPRVARAVSTLGVAGLVASALFQRVTEPAFGLALLMAGTVAVLHVWRREAVRPGRPAASAAAVLASAGWVVGAAMVVLALPEQLALRRMIVLPLLALLVLLIVGRRRMEAPEDEGLVEALLASPARLLVLSFAALGVVGAMLLVLPISATRPGTIRLIDALFTSVSASCVTGLIVLDTPNDFTLFGQVVILGLIQFGGLGIMTFAAAGAVFLGRRLGVREEAVAADLMGGVAARKDLERVLRTVVQVTLWSELAGAAALTLLFMAEGDTWGVAAWRGVFTSVSAFCNAGFALQSDNLIPYQHNPGVLLTVSALIVAGGLGPLVVAWLPWARQVRGTLHARLVVVTTAVLLVAPTVLFLALEWGGVLAEMSLRDKVVNAWFQSVTLRTAGFNSIDFAAIHPATWTLCVVAMFIGGSPGSTAGGVKTTTIAVLMLAVVATIRGRTEAAIAGRRIPHRTVYEAAAITTIGVLSAVAALMALQVTQPIALDHALFEVVSALGTVGLSMGATARLDDVGKVLIIACMFAGRVGPLTLFIFLVGRARPGRRYPLEAVQVG